MEYNPYRHNRELGNFFGTSSRHETAIINFMNWLQKRNPEAYAVLLTNKPDLVNARRVVNTQAITVVPSTLRGLADGSITTNEPVTSWGQDILNFFKETLPVYYQSRAQKDLIELNLRRAEQGLDPIDTGTIAPQVNVGVSSDMMQLGYIAVGGLVLVGLFSAFKARR